MSGGRSDAASVRLMTATLAHRGPDDSGIVELHDGRVVLGHRRLSIIDLSPLGHQPMASPDGRDWLVFNGELYNFREVRSELQRLGHSFRSESDTEVLLAAYREWGLESLKRFRGMFAFALWDGSRGTLHLARDRFGVKPLYYALSDATLAFASELKALNVAGYTQRRIDPVAVGEYLQFGYVSAPRSIFADVRVVEPGTVVSFDTALRATVRRYWSLSDLFKSEGTHALRQELATSTDDFLLDRLEGALTKAFQYRMVADVPVGVFLSGGIDSSLVSTLLARRAGLKVKTFTIGYGESEFDETHYAREVAQRLGTDHTEFIVSPDEALQLNARIPDIADEPIGDSSLIPTLMVSQLARRHVTVALSADGADELFGGYARYQICGAYSARLNGIGRWGYHMAGELVDCLPPGLVSMAYRGASGGGPRFAAINDKLRKFVRMARTRDEYSAYESAVSEWSAAQCSQLLLDAGRDATGAAASYAAPGDIDIHDRFMHFDADRYLPGDLLTKVDRASMAVSLEAREPCLDDELAQLAVALPPKWKIRNGQGKYALRRILARHLPSELFDRPKQGFSAPVADWLRGPLRAQMQDELAPQRVKSVGILDPNATEKSVSGFLSGDRESSAAGIWFLLQLQRWAGRWMTSPSSKAAETLRVK